MQCEGMNQMTRAIFTNAFNHLVTQTKFYAGLARSNRAKPGVHAAQLRRARENAIEARRYWRDLRAAGVVLQIKWVSQ